MDPVVTEASPYYVVRLKREKRLLILDLAYAWELLAARELEKRGKYLVLEANLACQNLSTVG